jgi:4-diphosphocytidyl-2-C-methyl-D-erythritol kinase
MNTTVEHAPAKLTLALRVLGRRPDGYHDLDALTVSLRDPVDIVTIEDTTSGIELVVAGEQEVPMGDENLAVRAANGFAAHTGITISVRITLGKRIPPGAGLGGGSADAAAVLRALARVHGVGLDDLVDVAATLGSDVPFCLHGGPAWMRGRGERVEPVVLAEPFGIVLVIPPFGVATPAVYAMWDELGEPAARRRVMAPRALRGLIDALANDLEPAAEVVEPRLARLREAITEASGAEPVLAGSGSASAVITDNEADAAALAHMLSARVDATVLATGFVAD